MKTRPVKNKLDQVTSVHEMVKAGMPFHLARHAVKRIPMTSPVKKKKP